jgi:ethanolamine ammonia-lyase small subunit
MTRSDPWNFLRKFTHARIGLGRAGHAIPTKEVLDFKLAFSRAKDSVWSEVDFTDTIKTISSKSRDSIVVSSSCKSKEEYLRNPGLGRKLNDDSKSNLKNSANDSFDCVLIISDGLSANAVHKNSRAFVDKFLELIAASNLKLGPVILAKYARVALGDEIGKLTNAQTTIMLIGERPGLASAESLSVYFTFGPDSKNTDAQRNCISNIHASGLSPEGAAVMTEFLLKTALQKRLSGVGLKVEYPGLMTK